MFTPQQIQEQTFSKAVYGGYDMQQVDDFLEPLTDDYIALYKENSVLKSKMKILVEKLEEYRGQEAAMKKAAADAQAKCDRMLAEAEAKCAAMVKTAETDVQNQKLDAALGAEADRLNYAKQTALNFIEVVEADIKGHLELLETLKSRDLTVEAPANQESAPAERPAVYSPAPAVKPLPTKPSAHEKPFDFEKDDYRVSPTAAPTPEDIASEISENMEKLVGAPLSQPQPKPVRPLHPESSTIKFDDLQFGKNYDPTR